MSERYTPRELKAMRVAYLTQQNVPQAEIRRILSIASQAEVSRLVAMARKNGWFVSVFRPPNDVDPDEIGTPTYEFLEKLRYQVDKLSRENSGVPVEEVHVLYSGPPDTEYEERLRRFGHLAAERVVTLLSQAGSCAVAWGETIMSLINGIERCSPQQRPEMMFMPLSGEPLNYTDSGVSSSTAAERLTAVFGCDKKLSLRSVATRVPRELDEYTDVIRKFVKTCEHYDEIFGGDSSLIANVDAIISGIDDVKSSEDSAYFREAQEAEETNTRRLHQFAAGNLRGVWLERDRNDAEQLKEVADVNRRWLGIQRQHFEDCAKRASDRKQKGLGAGVLVVAVGEGKAKIVKRAIGMINHLIIDHVLAERIADG